MELQEVRVGGLGRSSEIELVTIGDIHDGILNCDLEELGKTVAYVADNEYCYWIGMGDYWECIKHQDRRFDPRTIPQHHLARLGDIAQSQKEEIINILHPILKREKCLGLHGGNHEEELLLKFGEDLVGQVCAQFRLRNLGYKALSRIIFARGTSDTRAFVIHSQHGHGGGRKPGSKINLLHDLPANIDADVHIMGHVHDVLMDHTVQIRMSAKAVKLEAREMVLGTTGTFFKTYQEGNTNYAEQRDYPPTSIGCLKITFIPWSTSRRLHIEQLRT